MSGKLQKPKNKPKRLVKPGMLFRSTVNPNIINLVVSVTAYRDGRVYAVIDQDGQVTHYFARKGDFSSFYGRSFWERVYVKP